MAIYYAWLFVLLVAFIGTVFWWDQQLSTARVALVRSILYSQGGYITMPEILKLSQNMGHKMTESDVMLSLQVISRTGFGVDLCTEISPGGEPIYKWRYPDLFKESLLEENGHSDK